MGKGPALAIYAASLPWSGLSAELWSGLAPARWTSSALTELVVNLSRSGRLQRIKKPSRIRSLPRARPGSRVSPAPALLGRRLPRRTQLLPPWDRRSSLIEKET